MFIGSTILRVVLAHVMIFGNVASPWYLLWSRFIVFDTKEACSGYHSFWTKETWFFLRVLPIQVCSLYEFIFLVLFAFEYYLHLNSHP